MPAASCSRPIRQSDFVRAGIPVPFVQENHSHSARGTLRGLHYQRDPYAQGKFVRVVAGHIFDVAVDMRPESTTYKRWVGVDLTSDNRHGLYIPAGCAHGFCVLSETADVTYLLTGEYAPEHEAGIAWNDPTLGDRVAARRSAAVAARSGLAVAGRETRPQPAEVTG